MEMKAGKPVSTTKQNISACFITTLRTTAQDIRLIIARADHNSASSGRRQGSRGLIHIVVPGFRVNPLPRVKRANGQWR
jgi:hypothetical protein